MNLANMYGIPALWGRVHCIPAPGP